MTAQEDMVGQTWTIHKPQSHILISLNISHLHGFEKKVHIVTDKE